MNKGAEFMREIFAFHNEMRSLRIAENFRHRGKSTRPPRKPKSDRCVECNARIQTTMRRDAVTCSPFCAAERQTNMWLGMQLAKADAHDITSDPEIHPVDEMDPWKMMLGCDDSEDDGWHSEHQFERGDPHEHQPPGWHEVPCAPSPALRDIPASQQCGEGLNRSLGDSAKYWARKRELTANQGRRYREKANR